MKTDPNELRKRFLKFFDERMKAHARAHGSEVQGSLILPSSSLQPPDASTLFTSAGMHQFKDDFTGNLVHGTRAATTVQKCMRTPDLENVGKTARHHTFFEMLGFFSFGDGLKGPNGSVGFFKNEAIRWIWDFYTLPECEGGCALDKSKIYVSVYAGDETGAGRDDEAANIWREILSKVWPATEVERRIFFLGEHDNFWPAGAPSLGPNGVCGPCSEIFYDLGDEYGQGDVASNGARFMEIGNIVFTQYERSGPTPGKGTLTPLPAKNIDFGGGFERLVMVKEGAKATLDTRLFSLIREQLHVDLVAAAEDPTNSYRKRILEYRSELKERNSVNASTGKEDEQYSPARMYEGLSIEFVVREKRIADHVRAATFAMSDGILPGNEGAGYVIRRIIRRAYRDGTDLGFSKPFLCKLVTVVVGQYGGTYPELTRNMAAVAATVQQEEQQFSSTLQRGLELLWNMIHLLEKHGERQLAGKPAFDLYQSQGLPREVVQDELAAKGLMLDQAGYDKAEEEHRQRSKGGKQAAVFEKGWFQDVRARAKATEFTGYETCESPARVVAIVRDNALVDIIEAGDSATIVLDRTPFYGESGGQVGDRGSLQVADDPRTAPAEQGLFEVADTQKRDDIFLHQGKLAHGKLRVGDTVTARVDQQRRDRIRANHSATHLMHAALRRVLGDHVVQRGSEVGPDRLRFDFSHPKAVTFEERQQIEKLVNEQVQANAQVGTAIMSPEEAQQAGAMALFGEKYGDKVRVLSMGAEDRVAGVPPARDAAVPAARVAGFQPAQGQANARQRGRLPHWEAEGATYFVTFRLADSLAKEHREMLQAQRENLTRAAEVQGRKLSALERERLETLYSERMDEFLHAGYGECWLRNEQCAQIVATALRHFDGVRYELHAWCVMPNHVHVVFKPSEGSSLADVLHSWKSFTAKECNKILGRSGPFWMDESYDRLIRDEAEWQAKIAYTLNNPEAAGLKDWSWSGSAVIAATGAGETPAPRAAGTAATRAGGTPAARAFSLELCGGTHVARTGDIGYFRIVSEGSSASGIRRIEAVTGAAAYELAAEEARMLAQLHALTKAQPGKVLEKVEGLVKEVKDLKSRGRKDGGARLDEVRRAVERVGDASLYVADLGDAAVDELLTIKQSLGQDAGPFAVLLAARGDGGAKLLLAFSKDLVGRGLHAGKIVGEIARFVDGKGGGKPDVAQAGGRNPEGLPEALKQGREILRGLLTT